MYDAVVVGAGFSGLYQLLKLRQAGLTVRVFEAAEDVGGTWYFNRYPGAHCDTESMVYSYSFDKELEQEWTWTERCAPQEEILRYLQHVADRYDLRRDIQFNTRICQAHFDEHTNAWTVVTNRGDSISSRFFILGAGCLSTLNMPTIQGLESYEGDIYHTGDWPKNEQVDFKGKRVAVFGTGSTGMQCIPEIAKTAGHLVVFQRTPQFSLPARNCTYTPERIAEMKKGYPELRAQVRSHPIALALPNPDKSILEVTEKERNTAMEDAWEKGGFTLAVLYKDLYLDEKANKIAEDFVRNKIKQCVKDPTTAATLIPTDYPIFSKRITLNSGYFETYNRDNVELVDLRKTPIEEVTTTGIQTTAKDYPFDIIVFATGFDAITGSILSIDIRGIGGKQLKDKWQAGASAYLGLLSAGFPNLFMITGPGSPGVLVTMPPAIEQHVEWVTELINYMKGKGFTRVDAEEKAEEGWVEHVDQVAQKTVFVKAPNSWYLGENIPGKPRKFLAYPAGLVIYRNKCDEIAAKGYTGFIFK